MSDVGRSPDPRHASRPYDQNPTEFPAGLGTNSGTPKGERKSAPHAIQQRALLLPQYPALRGRGEVSRRPPHKFLVCSNAPKNAFARVYSRTVDDSDVIEGVSGEDANTHREALSSASQTLLDDPSIHGSFPKDSRAGVRPPLRSGPPSPGSSPSSSSSSCAFWSGVVSTGKGGTFFGPVRDFFIRAFFSPAG